MSLELRNGGEGLEKGDFEATGTERAPGVDVAMCVPAILIERAVRAVRLLALRAPAPVTKVVKEYHRHIPLGYVSGGSPACHVGSGTSGSTARVASMWIMASNCAGSRVWK